MHNGVSKAIEQHPKRAEILRRLLQGESTSKLGKEYGMHHSILLRTRTRIRQKVEPILSASLSQIDPDFASRTTIAKPITAWGIIEDLDRSRSELDSLKSHPDTKIHHRISIASTEARIAEALVKIMEVAARHRDIHRTPEYQNLELAIARTIRRIPEAEKVFNDEFSRLEPVRSSHAEPPETQEDYDDDIRY